MNSKCVLLVSAEPSALAPALTPFTDAGFAVREESSLAAALPHIDPAAPPALVLLDASSNAASNAAGNDSGKALREAASAVLSRCALTYLAAVSPMDPESFHDAMEGLGMLPPLPPHPTKEDGEALLESLRRFLPA
ncbi:MAG: hypothetical protein IKX79_04925 [Desulfovibrionaceae bacterium]|nr:hypothetical protein [Desulfovibrionaceae bacterium]